MSVKHGRQVYEVTILQMVFGGDGLARLPDGRAVFIPFSLPNEIVRIEITDEKKRFARGQILDILRPHPKRIPARCPYFGVCGGCHYQHIPYIEQLKVKQDVFIEQLQRIGGLDTDPVQQIQPSPLMWNYRNALQFHLSNEGQLGFYASNSHDLIAIQECHLPLPGIDAVWPHLDFEPGSDLQRVELLQGVDEEILLALHSEDLPPEMQLDLPISVVHLFPEGDLILAGNGYRLMQIDGKTFSVSAGSFFQVNDLLVSKMIDELLSQLELSEEKIVMDLYCGVGLFSAFLAPHVHQVIAVEMSGSACQDFILNLDDCDNVSLYEGSVEEVLPGLQIQPDIIVVDPPRSGLDRRVLDAILQKGPDQVAYISCDPPTLARDLKRLVNGGYRLERIVPFDLFPQTYHIESISFLKKIIVKQVDQG